MIRICAKTACVILALMIFVLESTNAVKQNKLNVLNTSRRTSTPRGTSKLSITADDQIVEVYVDGNAISVQQGGWGVVRVVDIPYDAQVIAVKAIDTNGVVSGILASVNGYKLLLTGTSWKCTTSSVAGWMSTTFDDESWPNAVISGTNTASDIHGNLPMINSSAKWIWTSNYKNPVIDKTVHCRGHFERSIPKSCREVQAMDSSAPSGEYTLVTSTLRTLRKVYCEMGLNEGGYTFIHPFDLPHLTQAELKALFTDSSSFLLRVRLSNGLQKFGVLQQLTQYRSTPLSLQVNSNNGYNTPQNVNNLGSNYLYYGFLPINSANSKTTQGLRVNGKDIPFVNCDANANSYFALFSDFSESAPSSYGLGSTYPMYNTILSSLQANPSRRVMPDDFFTFFEIHFGGCGLYTQSDSRQDSLGVISATIGFR